MIRARDIREKLRGRVEPVLLHTLEALAEEQSAIRHTMTELAQQLDRLANLMLGQHQVIDEVARHTIKRVKTEEAEPDLGPTSL